MLTWLLSRWQALPHSGRRGCRGTAQGTHRCKPRRGGCAGRSRQSVTGHLLLSARRQFAILLLLCVVPARAADGDFGAAERRLFALVNQERRAHGGPALRWNEDLARVARAHSRDMRDRRFFAHLTPEGRTPLDRVLGAGISFSRVGENLALDRTVEEPHRVMMAEPAGERNHRGTLLNPAYTDAGIGIVADGEWLYITEEFITAGGAGGEWDVPGAVAAGMAGLNGRVSALTNQMAQLHERLGRMALLAGDAKGAADSFQAALRADARCPRAQAGLGEAHERLGKPEDARAACAAALAVDPDDAEARLRLAMLCLAAGRPAEAEPHFLALMRLRREDARVWYHAARCAAARAEPAAVEERLARAIALDGTLREAARKDAGLAPVVEGAGGR